MREPRFSVRMSNVRANVLYPAAILSALPKIPVQLPVHHERSEIGLHFIWYLYLEWQYHLVAQPTMAARLINPTLKTTSPLRNFVNNAQRRIKRALAKEESIKVPDIPDEGQLVALHHQKMETQ